jgi:hypothetical protein
VTAGQLFVVESIFSGIQPCYLLHWHIQHAMVACEGAQPLTYLEKGEDRDGKSRGLSRRPQGDPGTTATAAA